MYILGFGDYVHLWCPLCREKYINIVSSDILIRLWTWPTLPPPSFGQYPKLNTMFFKCRPKHDKFKLKKWSQNNFTTINKIYI